MVRARANPNVCLCVCVFSQRAVGAAFSTARWLFLRSHNTEATTTRKRRADWCASSGRLGEQNVNCRTKKTSADVAVRSEFFEGPYFTTELAISGALTGPIELAERVSGTHYSKHSADLQLCVRVCVVWLSHSIQQS